MRNDFEPNYLAHHGILGMKWGKRNGPPYPLDQSQKTSAEKHKEQLPGYIKMWSKQGAVEGNKAYVHMLKLNRDIKLASPRDVLKAYMKATESSEVDHGQFSRFAVDLIDKTSETNKKFFEELKAMGFDGLIDPNDSDYITGKVFGSYTKEPLIFIDPASFIASSKVKKLGFIGSFMNVITS